MDLPNSTPVAASPSYWCYQCNRIVNVPLDEAVTCPFCHGGFVHLVDPTDLFPEPNRYSRAASTRRRRTASSFNPLVVLRNPSEPGSPAEGRISYDLFYDDGDGVGLRPLPSSMSESLLGSGFETMLDRLSQIGFSLWARPENAPASKRAVAALPFVEIAACHVDSDLHCAVCTEAFALGSEGREMPCKHVFHSDCLVPWLDLHNTCPLCRHELPNEETHGTPPGPELVGLTIWRLPGGGFAVGRFVGGGDGEMPAVYSEVDWALSLNGGSTAGIGWNRRRRGNIFRRIFGSIFRRAPVRSGSLSGLGLSSGTGMDTGSGSIFGRLRSSRSRNSLATAQLQ